MSAGVLPESNLSGPDPSRNLSQWSAEVAGHEAARIVELLYRALLGRPPDPHGLASKRDSIVSGKSFVSEVIRDLLASPEYEDRRNLLTPGLTRITHFPDDELFVSDEVVDALFERASRYWRRKASDPKEMYWSVLTVAEWQEDPSDHDKRRFIRGGKQYTRRVLELHEKLSGRKAADLECLELGPGVGRLAVNFAQHTSRVHAADFSEAHLQELSSNAGLFECSDKVVTWPLQTARDLERLPAVDLVYSYIALQHNPPPVIARLMELLLGRLKAGGHAFLHVTLAKSDYAFSPDSYLADESSGREMEVHILPKANINTIAERAGCEIVMSHCVGGNDFAYSEEIVFRRPGV